MIILAIDSTAKAASAAVSDGEKVLAYEVSDTGLMHSEILLAMAEEVLKDASLTLSDVDAFGVTVGPGSFTGVRVGTALVKGLSFRYPVKAENVPNCVPVSATEALAENLCPLPGIYLPVMDARRGGVYNAVFRSENGKLIRLCKDRAISLASLREELKDVSEPVFLCGDGYDLAKDALSGFACVQDTPYLLRTQNAASVARVAARLAKEGKMVFDKDLRPVYLRLPQAERERLEKNKKSKDEEK
ncbi:MAG: tRNA (adenosine(37)-N6)-threonylcarbamoyltransferase complex dimerization subunit type 1 TsaB [Clostridia bacterium]|nr:tRNA (adenosine(37)-N6)-threonylcarbamoyltransferase complex dimerization subunit type 1 TsaB [Clostridia bacterium]